MRAVSPLLQRFPFVGILACAVAGILLAESCGNHLPLLVVAVGIPSVLLALVPRGGICWGSALLCFASMHWWSWNESPARRLAEVWEAGGATYSVRGIVCGEPKILPSGSAVFPLRVERVASEEKPDSPILSPVTVQVRWEGERPLCGDEVGFSGRVVREPPPRNPGAMDYRRWLERQGIFSVFTADPSLPGTILRHGAGSGLRAAAIRCRTRMKELLSLGLEGSPDVAAAISGICLGVTEGAPEGFLDEFRFTGTMHLFAVSGLHVGMVAVILWFLLSAFRIPRHMAVGLIIPALFFYVLVTGLKMGSVRSAVMSSLLLIGLSLLRRSPLLNTLAAAAFLQLAFDTNALFSAGWQFSYSVVAAIILATPFIEVRALSLYRPDPFLPARLLTRAERFRFACWHRFCGLAAVSAAAWIGALVPTLVYFHLVSFSALGANILAVPLAFGVLSLGMLSLGTGILSPWMAGAFNNTNWLVVKVLLAIVQGSTLIPGGHWFLGPPAPSWPVFTILDLHGMPSALIGSGSNHALLDAGRKKEARSVVLPCLEVSGVNSLGEVLVSRADAAHMGGLEMIGRQHRIRRLDLPPDAGRSPYSRKKGPPSDSAIRLREGDLISPVPGVTARILAPERGDFLVPRIDLGGLSILWIPGLTNDVLEALSSVDPNQLRSDVLVLPLGGVPMAEALDLIRKVRPRALVSPILPLLRGGLPVSDWDPILRQEGITYLRMDRTGAIVLEADPRAPRLRTWVDGVTVPLGPALSGKPAPR